MKLIGRLAFAFWFLVMSVPALGQAAPTKTIAMGISSAISTMAMVDGTIEGVELLLEANRLVKNLDDIALKVVQCKARLDALKQIMQSPYFKNNSNYNDVLLEIQSITYTVDIYGGLIKKILVGMARNIRKRQQAERDRIVAEMVAVEIAEAIADDAFSVSQLPVKAASLGTAGTGADMSSLEREIARSIARMDATKRKLGAKQRIQDVNETVIDFHQEVNKVYDNINRIAQAMQGVYTMNYLMTLNVVDGRVNR
jgi:Golgi nucleoside diphosphatase